MRLFVINGNAQHLSLLALPHQTDLDDDDFDMIASLDIGDEYEIDETGTIVRRVA
jgi:hypothetical protein